MRFINHEHLQPINAHPTQGDGLHGIEGLRLCA